MSKITIRTNNQYRPLLSWGELTEKERKDFDYIDNPEEESGFSFFRYKGTVYYLGDIERTGKDGIFSEWDGVEGFSAFSGLLIKFSNCGEGIKIAYFYY